jgi:hypothetical protein
MPGLAQMWEKCANFMGRDGWVCLVAVEGPA